MLEEDAYPLHCAAAQRNTRAVNGLLKAGWDADQHHLITGLTPLHLACETGHLSAIRALIHHGADVNAQTRRHGLWSRTVGGRTPLHLASSRGHSGAAKALLDAGADVSAADEKGDTALHAASEAGHTAVVRRLLRSGADATARNRHKITPLSPAVDGGHSDIVRLLRAAGAKPTFREAVVLGDLRLVRQYIRSGEARIGIELHCAAERGHTKMAALLLAQGALVDMRDGVSCETALHCAARSGSVEVARLLLDKGADVNARDEDGWTPLYVARMRQQTEVAELLQEHGGIG